MEHTQGNVTLAVLARFIRRYWRVPAKFMGMIAIVVVLLLALPFLPRPEVKVDAASAAGPGESGATVESLYARGVGAPFTGAVALVGVKPGQVVKKNDLLFRMDANSLAPQLAAAQEAVAEAKNGVKLALESRAEEIRPLVQEVAESKNLIAKEQAAATAPQTPLTWNETTAEGAIVVMTAPQPMDETVTSDPARLQDLQARLAAAQARLAERQQAWAPTMAEAQARVSAANVELQAVRKLIAAADRRSPIDGVVTRINVDAGHWADVGTTVVRVDNPQGYRVVSRVGQEGRDAVKIGAALPVSVAGAAIPGKLEKIVPGQDKELGTYWLWVRPTEPTKLRPGQQVHVSLQPTDASLLMAGN
jgi:multidrug efflux pump subunit AcrA (membrane-fusion protein)